MTSFSPRSWLKWWRSASRSARCRTRRTAARLNLEPLEERQLLATFTVTNANNSGSGSLRQAILNANSTPAADVIRFSVGYGPKDLAPTSPLPEITNPVTLDGTTQPGYSGTPLITIGGGLAGPFSEGLVLRGSNSIVRALTIRSFNGHGIVLYGNSNAIERSYIGIDPFQTFGAGNRDAGVSIENGSNNVLRGNVISGNGWSGVMISGTAALSNVVASSAGFLGNFIGTNATGTFAVPNGQHGVWIGNGASLNTIGGGPNRNVISGNTWAGVTIVHSGTSNNQVYNNLIGTNAFGTAVLGNSQGVFVGQGARFNRIGPFTGGAPNVISGNRNEGVVLTDAGTSNNVVERNFIGTNFAGTAAVPNQRDGVWIGNGARSNSIAGNVLSGNNWSGVALFHGSTRSNVVRGNYIGTTVTGDGPLGNGAGVWLNQGANQNTIGGSSPVERNVIAANRGPGVMIRDVGTSHNVVAGNSIGTNAAGTAALGNFQGVWIAAGASDNQIGFAGAGGRNLISGNRGEGVALTDAGTVRNLVQGNYIGTDAAGTAALGNVGHGVWINQGAQDNSIGGANGEGNVISGNRAAGVALARRGTNGNRVQGNTIGLNAAGTAALGNRDDGVAVVDEASNNRIGGTTPGSGNVIAFNGGIGVAIDTGTGNAIQGNRLFNNGRLGIDLGGGDVTANDPGDIDSGANNLQNFPVLTSAASSGSQTVITGTLNSTANETFRLEFFASPAADPSGFGEGETFLGALTVTTDADGNASFTATGLAALPADATAVTATATNMTTSDTSEFSAVLALAGTGAPVAVNDAYSVDADNTLTVEAPGVLSNDRDPNGDRLTALLVSGPANGTLTLNADGSFSYTPNAGFTGTDSFTYKANDGSADSNEATVTITVNALRQALAIDGNDTRSVPVDAFLQLFGGPDNVDGSRSLFRPLSPFDRGVDAGIFFFLDFEEDAVPTA